MIQLETDVNKRWEHGINHHPKSKEIIKALAELDYHLTNDFLSIKTGGDGDNWEAMMYLLDIYFEGQDRGIDLKTIIAHAKSKSI